MRITFSKMHISFAWTVDAFLNGTKTATRRYWKESHARKFKAGMVVRALDKDYRANGKQVGWALITKTPYLQPLEEMTEADFIAEGGTQYWETLADYQWMMKREGKVPYVVEFIRCNEKGERIVSSDEQKEESLKDKVRRAAMERAGNAIDVAWNDIWNDKQEAARVWAEDDRDEDKFHYKVGVAVDMHPKGSGKVDVSAKASWSVKKTCEPPGTEVDEHPELPGLLDKPNAGDPEPEEEEGGGDGDD